MNSSDRRPRLARITFYFRQLRLRYSVIGEELQMSKDEREKLQKALRELTRENDSKEKVTHLFMKDGYFDENGKLAQEFRDPE
jgi:hypothetical protein